MRILDNVVLQARMCFQDTQLWLCLAHSFCQSLSLTAAYKLSSRQKFTLKRKRRGTRSPQHGDFLNTRCTFVFVNLERKELNFFFLNEILVYRRTNTWQDRGSPQSCLPRRAWASRDLLPGASRHVKLCYRQRRCWSARQERPLSRRPSWHWRRCRRPASGSWVTCKRWCLWLRASWCHLMYIQYG